MIARGTLVPAWNWISNVLLPQEAAAYTAECRNLVLARKHDDALARAAQFWTLAATAITGALSGATGRDTVRKALGADVAAVEDVAEMALLLSAGDAMERLVRLLPAPVPTFNEQLVWQAREIYDELVKSHPDVAPYVARSSP